MRRLSNSLNFPVSVVLATVAALALLSLAAGANAANLKTHNDYVEGQVDDFGRVVWSVISGPGAPYSISFSPPQSMSFLTVMIDGKYYTNNSQGPRFPSTLIHGTDWFDLTSPTNTRILSAKGDGRDTIRTTWKVGQIDVVQDAYPFQFEKSGQIVLKVRLVNHGLQSVAGAAQYLLDIDVQNDRAQVLTRWGYSPNWNQYIQNATPPIDDVPWFYMAFKTPLPAGAGDMMSTGYLDNKAEGLIKPYRVTIGDWTKLLDWIWGPPTPLPTGAYGDEAILMEWPPTGVPAARSDGTPGVVELARTSYGTGEFEICTGNLFTLTFYPHRLHCQGSGYDQNPFEVETLAFNTSETNTASAVSVNLHVTDPLQITGPGTVTNGGKDCSISRGTIATLGVADFIWNVQSKFVTKCNGDSAASLKLTATAQGLTLPIISNDCEMPLIVECCDQDTLAPRSFGFSGTAFDTTFTVHDNLVNDKGLQDITWSVSSGNASDFTITVNPPKPIVNCPKSDYTVHVTQKDSTKGGCIDFTFVDCANNTSYHAMCFPAHIVPDKPDIANPEIVQIGAYGWPTVGGVIDTTQPCLAQVDTFRVTELAQFDRGLRTIAVAGAPTNMRLILVPFKDSASVAGFAVAAIDPMQNGAINVVATDVVGHTDTAHVTYCAPPDIQKPIITASGLTNYAWHVIVTDSQQWDRGLADVAITSPVNVTVTPMPTPATVNGLKKYEFDVAINDHFKDAGVCITATDLAGNVSSKLGSCLSFNGQTDIWRPNINVTPALTTNPIAIQVDVNDIHLIGPDTLMYDTGIDSVWFTGVYNMTLKYNGNTYVDRVGGPHDVFPSIKNPLLTGATHPFDFRVPVFSIWVTDTAAVDSLACITIHTVDGRFVRDKDGVNQTDLQWCYPVALDSLAPQMTGTSPDRTHILLHVTDERVKDRGLKKVEAKNTLNFDPINGTEDIIQYSGDTAADVTLTVTTPGKSSVAHIEALDLFGSKLASPPAISQHTATSDLWIYAQNLKMKAGHIVLQPGDFDVPVYLDSTDVIPIGQKQIGEFRFGFHLTGSDLITFVSPITAGTLTNGWNVTATPGTSRDFVIDGTAVPSGAVLATAPGATYDGSPNALPLVILRFHGDPSDYSGMTSIVVDGEPGAEIAYNGGGTQTLNGVNSVVEIPKPYGTISGGNVILKGACSPIVDAGGKPSIIALERAFPTPATKGADPSISCEYTIPESSAAAAGSTHVTVELYSITGEKIATLIDQQKEPGRYRLAFPTSQLNEGTYIIRMLAGQTVLSRRAVVR